MIYLKTIYFSSLSVATLFILCKLMGKRQISQLSMFDYINGISIGSIAAEMSTETDSDPLIFICAMSVYALLSILISIINSKSIIIRKFFEGNSLLLYSSGKLYRKNFKKCKLDLNEFLALLRIKGYYDLSLIETIILETNGQLSVREKEENKPATKNELGIKSNPSGLVYNIIIDGKVMQNSLASSQIREDELIKRLKKESHNVEDIFLATYDPAQEKYDFYEKNNEDAISITS